MTLDIDHLVQGHCTPFPKNNIYNKSISRLRDKEICSGQGIIKGFWCGLELSDLEKWFKFTAHSISDVSLWMKYEIRKYNLPQKDFTHWSALTLTFSTKRVSSRSLHSLYANALCVQRMNQIELRGEKICFGQDIPVGQTTNRLITTGLPQSGDLWTSSMY